MVGQMVCCLSWVGKVSELFEGPLFRQISYIGRPFKSNFLLFSKSHPLKLEIGTVRRDHKLHSKHLGC